MRRVVWGSGCAVVAFLLSACWPVPGQNADRTSHNPFEIKISGETVGDLEELWRYEVSPIGGWDVPLKSVVVSLKGLHATGSCGIVTLDAGTGAKMWEDTFVDPVLGCGFANGGFATSYAEAPHAFIDQGSSLVVAGYGWFSDWGGPGRLPMAEWVSPTFDAATGERLDSLGSAVVATRGTDYASSSLSWTREDYPPYPLVVMWTQTVHVGELGSPGRSFRVARSTSATSLGTAKLTLGEHLVFHSGSGSLTTSPEMAPQVGSGVRAYSPDEARPGCSPIAGDPLECPVWATPTDGDPTTPVIGEGGAVVFARTPQTLYALGSVTGDVLWTAEGVGAGDAPAVAEGLLYLPTSDGRVLVFDAAGCGGASCEPLWEVDIGSGAEVSTPTIAGDVLYLASGGSAYAFSADGCGEPACGGHAVLWSAAGDTQPVVSFGQLYTTDDGAVVAYGLD